ncbi:MAG: DUF4350 domain-containing protein [Planctomycetota bacterium]
MMRRWIALALLSGSWLLGLGYFSESNAIAWAAALVAAVFLLGDTPVRLPKLRQRIAIAALLIPTVWFVPFPYEAIVVLLLVGVTVSMAPIYTTWVRRIAHGSIVAGTILLPQAMVLLVYQARTARAHELPAPCAECLAALTRLLNADAAVDSGMLVLRNASITIRLGATWELLLAPGTVCFITGGCVLLLWSGLRQRAKFNMVLRDILVLLLLTAAWAPLRAALLATVVLQQKLRATPITYPNVGETLVSTWVHIVLLIAFATISGFVLKHRFKRERRPSSSQPRHPSTSRQCQAAAACAIGVALLTFLYFWTPVGQRKNGRVMFVERHSTWEPTTEPYGTQVYGEAGSYNYAAIYEYCSQYYDMSRLLPEDAIDDATLKQCDVLIIKTPTSRYTPDEVEAVTRFVNHGGSLILIGDHTNVFNMNTYLNDISRHFGFTFRNDLLFRIGSPYRQVYEPPRVGHPVLQYMPTMDFAVSCSIDPGSNRGTMAIRNVGLYNLPPAYHESNYHPQAEYRPYMQYGAWCQLWSTTQGKGRVIGFADSTLFSNFCTFQPGKAELFIGMIEWLNHRSPFDSPLVKRLLVVPLVLVAIALLLIGLGLARGLRGGWLLLLAVGATAWAGASQTVLYVHQSAMPRPPKHASMPHVVIDRTVSTVPLFTGAFADAPEGSGYGMLEQWIPRLGNYISRRSGQEVFQGDGLVLICPTKLPSPDYRDRLVEWVRDGGRLIVFDTPDVENSTANSILMLFGMRSSPGAPEPEQENAPVRMTDDSAQTPLAMSCAVSGGTPVALWGDSTVAARKSFGEGNVTAIGFGSLFNDAAMGHHWMADPDEQLRGRYEMLYALLRAGLEN